MYTYIMQRTQISLTAEERRALDAEAARTGRSISALIRDAVEIVYGTQRSSEDDLADMRRAFGSWADRDLSLIHIYAVPSPQRRDRRHR